MRLWSEDAQDARGLHGARALHSLRERHLPAEDARRGPQILTRRLFQDRAAARRARPQPPPAAPRVAPCPFRN